MKGVHNINWDELNTSINFILQNLYGVMKHLGTVLCICLLFSALKSAAQVSADCSTAIPICNDTPVNGGTTDYGVDDFNGATSTGCLEQTTSGHIESNSAWYRFRTGASGQLGFNIGFDSSEDWDFALYRASDCGSLGEPIRCNFFDNSENASFTGVGESPEGDVDSVQYEEWLEVSPGEDYYLLVNNFSNQNSGFSVQFSGQIFVTNPNDALDCSIVSNLLGPPISACDNENIVLDATTSNATQYNWFVDNGSGFQQLLAEHNATLQVVNSAMYRVEVFTSTGTIYSDVQVSFSSAPTTATVTDDTFCSSLPYTLSQKDAEALGGQNPNQVLVSYHSSLSDAIDGSNALPDEYTANAGAHTIYVRTTSTSNANCFDVSQDFELTVVQTPVVDFETEVFLCDGAGSATIGDTSPNVGYTYAWSTGATTPTIQVSEADRYAITITNTVNGQSCSYTGFVQVYISNPPVIADIEIDDLQPQNTVTVIPEEEGEFMYQIDDEPLQEATLFENVLPGEHQIRMVDVNGCGETVISIVVVGFPHHFSPNGDGINDVWNIVGIEELEEPVIYVFDRYGKLLKQMSKYDAGWDGTFNGQTLPETDYWFKLSYVDFEGQRVYAKYIQNHFSLRR